MPKWLLAQSMEIERTQLEASQASPTQGKRPPASLGEVRAATRARMQPTSSQGGQSSSGSGGDLRTALRLVDQLDARVRELEGAMFETVAMPMDHPIIAAAKEASSAYAAAVKGRPQHEWGSPHVHVAAALLEAAADVAPPDPAAIPRLVALKCLVVAMAEQRIDEVGGWIRSFRARLGWSSGSMDTS